MIMLCVFFTPPKLWVYLLAINFTVVSVHATTLPYANEFTSLGIYGNIIAGNIMTRKSFDRDRYAGISGNFYIYF